MNSIENLEQKKELLLTNKGKVQEEIVRLQEAVVSYDELIAQVDLQISEQDNPS